jgi:predicted NBD/HSP70 family sugar kinase
VRTPAASASRTAASIEAATSPRPSDQRSICAAERIAPNGLATPGDRAGVDAVMEVVARAKAGEPAPTRAIERVGHWLGVGLAGLINVFDPERVVLGGMYGRAFEVFEPVLVETLKVRALTSSSEVDVVPAGLGFDAPLIGAAELVFAPLLEQPDLVMDELVKRRAK